MKLRYDPFQVFHNSHTPAGLYARQKWLEEANTLAWKTDFKKRVTALSTGQMPDGSWQNSSIATVSALFGLHLTVRATNRQIEDALNWLLKKSLRMADVPGVPIASDLDEMDLKGLPFVTSRPDMLLIGATLFLCSIFDRQHDPAVWAGYQRVSSDDRIKKYLRQDIAAMHNIFRALVVHPVFAREGLSAEAAAMYADLQGEDGLWGNGLPFFQTVNALAHLNSPESEAQLERAFSRLFATQHADGTWGRQDREWNTFLCIHALKNKGLL